MAARVVKPRWAAFVAALTTVFLTPDSYGADAHTTTVGELLEALRSRGANIIYSSDLVDPQMRVPEDPPSSDPWERARRALASHGLELRQLGANRFAVVRQPEARPAPKPDVVPGAAPAPQPLEEVSVYASRYTFGRDSLAEARLIDQGQIESTPGTRDDALRSVRVVPGFATNASTRPYIRGSMADDVLVLFDGVPLADPFHLKNFQSLVSAFDPEAVERIEIYSGGFPVRYGTRSGGVMDIEPRSLSSGYENTVGVSLLAYDVASVGQSERWPVDWLVTARHTLSEDVALKPAGALEGEPQFSDSLGRLRWRFENGSSLTFGWLLLDDEIALTTQSLDEHANATYRDEYGWVAFEVFPSGQWQSRTIVSGTRANRNRTGTLVAAGLANESLDEERELSSFEFQSQLTYAPRRGESWDLSIEASRSAADLRYARIGTFAPETALLFDRSIDNTLVALENPRVSTYAASISHLHRWSSFDSELGLRWDAQNYRGENPRSQLSPRVNVRYDLGGHVRAYGSWGRFSQAQRAYEWRTEDAQMRPDRAALATHTILGVSYNVPGAWRVTAEAYHKHWSTVTPYYDNLFTTLSLVPDLQPDRQLLAPSSSEASGIELSVRRAIGESLAFWAAYTYSRATDNLGLSRDVPRSWDQPHALSAGANWNPGSWKTAFLIGWHTGWPHAPFRDDDATGAFANEPADVRNSTRWGTYFTLDLSASWTRRSARSDLELRMDLTNATDRDNACCLHLLAPVAGQTMPAAEDKAWLPRTLNVGLTWRWHSPGGN